MYPEEIGALYQLYSKHRVYQPDKRPLEKLAKIQNDYDFCYTTLGKVSRSFSVVIQQLSKELRDPVCIFYLVLRALDSIEDDTSADPELRRKLLIEFYLYLDDPSWCIEGVGDKKDYRILLEHFQKVTACYQRLKPENKEIIARICREMGAGMSSYLDQEVMTKRDFDKYCYYVAGLVGVGLTELFVASGLESAELSQDMSLPVSMGLFLQKTNIIRDYLEDLQEGRTFWPREIWGKYARNLHDFTGGEEKSAIHCLNELVTDALSHAPDCLTYLSSLKNPHIFNFCAIPQVMAIATLTKIYQNPDVFRRNVKIRKGLAAHLIFTATDYPAVESLFRNMSKQIHKNVDLADPNVTTTTTRLKAITDFALTKSTQSQNISAPPQVVLSKIKLRELIKSYIASHDVRHMCGWGRNRR